MKNKHLVLIFLLLVAAVILSRKQFGKRERSFEAVLIETDTSALSAIVFTPPDGDEFSLTKEANGWIISDGVRSAAASPEPISKLLNALQLIESRQIASKNRDQWPEYGLSEQQAFRVRLYRGGKVIHDFMLGDEGFDPQTQSIFTYLRMTGENTVFVTDGAQMVNIGRDFDSYRHRVLLRMKRDMEVTEFQWANPDTAFAFVRTPAGWVHGDSLLDSMAVENYLNVMRNISGEQFADDFDEMQAEQYLHKTLTMSGKNIPEPFVIQCFHDSLRRPPFLIRSSQNPRAFFKSDSTDLYRKVFPEAFY
jgi:hypothetical protein